VRARARCSNTELDVERAAERVQVLVHAEGLAHPFAHELLLEHVSVQIKFLP
jgi:hypothetical protein